MSYSIEEANRFRKNHDEKMVRVVKWLEQRDVFAFVSSIYITEKDKYLYLLKHRTQVTEAERRRDPFADKCKYVWMYRDEIFEYPELQPIIREHEQEINAAFWGNGASPRQDFQA